MTLKIHDEFKIKIYSKSGTSNETNSLGFKRAVAENVKKLEPLFENYSFFSVPMNSSLNSLATVVGLLNQGKSVSFLTLMRSKKKTLKSLSCSLS